MSRSFRVLALALAMALIGLDAGCGGHKDVAPTAFAPPPTGKPQAVGAQGGTSKGGAVTPPLTP